MAELTPAELAGAARSFVRRRRHDATAGDVYAIARGWSTTGWQAVAAVELGVLGVHAELMFAALDLLADEAG